ncbi:hypothetical protein [Thalassotalea sp. G2M2-11]|uniref:hypothetical protein n=1 Tax=Thalassotalea sp. G2M2-11 TaxID=2787627 RepID=UPI0019CFA29D|nr:hypothetical protein [Thalassotalea sp. G2M2-11]
MSIETSGYQHIKLIILDLVDLSRDAIHIHIGLAVFLLAIIFWRRQQVDLWALVPVFLIACLMEALDLRDDLATFGYLRWSASLHDVINTVFWPTIAVITSKFLSSKKSC